MTDSKTVVEDLAAWLTGIWDEEEVWARAVLDRSEPWKGEWVNDENLALRTRNGWVLASHGGKPFAFGLLDHIVRHDPASVLARIAADRKILALHSFHMVPSLDSRLQPIPGSRRPHCDTCASQDENGEDWPCVTVRLLAEPHADKPGFRSEWLVERQGVER